jgi:diguanylate cyclase (GGDEF)-like protein/PAS domain S-box-containing protein
MTHTPLMDHILKNLLRESDGLLQGLLSNALTGVYVIQDDRFIYVNQHLAEIFGYTQSVLCSGMGPADLTAPAYREQLRQEIAQRLNGKIQASFHRFQGIHHDGYLIDLEGYGVATSFENHPAIIGILIDISQRVAAETEVADQLRFISQLVDVMPSPVFYKDEDGRYLGCNTAFEHYIGLQRDELIGKSVYDLSPKELADKYFAADKALFESGGTQTYEAEVAYADGSRHAVVFYKARFNKADGNPGGLVGVIHDISERKLLEKAIWHDANYDNLTGLPNRRLCRERLQEEIRRTGDGSGQLALLFIDLDRFKKLNDTLGHYIGDLLLVQVAERIRAILGPGDTASRQGGDEFIVILPQLKNREEATTIARKITSSLEQPFDLNGRLGYVSASIGIAFCPQDSDNMETLIRYADQAMFAAKTQGRNGYCHYQPVMQEQALLKLEIGNDLRQALKAGQFELYLQPIVGLTNPGIYKAEALLRWRHPQRGLVPPGVFIPIAEDIGMISELGDWVFRQAMDVAIEWQAALKTLSGETGCDPVKIQISVNISPRQFLAGTCGKAWIDYLLARGLAPQVLAVEITEGLLLDDRPVVIDALKAFHEAGVQVSIDDFGTGYSAMSYLKKFEIDFLKIDRSFINDLGSSPADQAIVEAMIVMAHKLGMQVIAEGVETEDQSRMLQVAGCDFAQGYLFARPMPIADFFQTIPSRITPRTGD